MSPSIFVQIPAYRDTELPLTLLDLYEKTECWDSLRVVVLWQRAKGDVLPRNVQRLPNIEIIQVPSEKSGGCNWARHLLQKEWRGEPYTLLLDSHHRFVKGWDLMAVNMYEGLRKKGVQRPILTAYLPEYFPEVDPNGRRKEPSKIYPLARQDGMLVRVTSYPIPYWRSLKGPIVADFIGLHFLFTDGRFNRDVPFDPELYFVGDEVAITVRSYTQGYDLFHPNTVLGWHCYDRESRITHWHDHSFWPAQHHASMRRLRKLFGGQLSSPYGIGTERSIQDFEEHLLLPLMESSK